MTFAHWTLALSACLLLAANGPAAARSKAAQWLIDEQIGQACSGGSGTIDEASLFEGDLTGDGQDDLIIGHEGISCDGGGRSIFCGAQACSLLIYVRRGDLLELEVEMLSVGFSVAGDGTIRTTAHGGRPGSLRWNGSAFE